MQRLMLYKLRAAFGSAAGARHYLKFREPYLRQHNYELCINYVLRIANYDYKFRITNYLRINL